MLRGATRIAYRSRVGMLAVALALLVGGLSFAADDERPQASASSLHFACREAQGDESGSDEVAPENESRPSSAAPAFAESTVGDLPVRKVESVVVHLREDDADDGDAQENASGSDSPLKITDSGEAKPVASGPELVPPPTGRAKAPVESTVGDLPPAQTAAPKATPRRTATNGDNLAGQPRIRPIGSLSVNIAPPVARDDQGRLLASPPNVARAHFAQPQRTPAPSLPYSDWMGDYGYGSPLNFCYRPLFFEEVNLERYGYSWGVLQPAVSAAKFYGNVALVPYRLVAQHPCECAYHDHLYRPGAPAPREIQVPQRPLSHLRD